jgi:integrase/recombinase XerD
MGRKSPLHAIRLAQACDGMTLAKQAAGRSPNTINNYLNAFAKLRLFLPDNPPFAAITRAQLVAFFSWLETDHLAEPDGVAPRAPRKLAAKTCNITHGGLSALWAWAVAESIVPENLVRSIEPPQFSEPDTLREPHTLEDVEALLKACEHTRAWKHRAGTTNSRPSGLRDAAILLTLLDTGIRASELVNLRFRDLNLKNNSFEVIGKGRGGGKKRTVYFGKRTRALLWKYLLPRLETKRDDDLVFVNEEKVGGEAVYRRMTRTALYKRVARIGARAGVKKAHPHRFRHTFAITYLLAFRATLIRWYSGGDFAV